MRLLDENTISPIAKQGQPERMRFLPKKEEEASLVLTCVNDDFYDVNNLNQSMHGHSKLNDFVVNPGYDGHAQNRENLDELQQILAENNIQIINASNQHLFQPLTIDTSYQATTHLHLNTPTNMLDSNQFIDELGITVRREVNYVDHSNLLMIHGNMNQLATGANGVYNITNSENYQATASNNEQAASNVNVQAAGENEEDEVDIDETQEYSYSQVEGEKGRACKRTPVVKFPSLSIFRVQIRIFS